MSSLLTLLFVLQQLVPVGVTGRTERIGLEPGEILWIPAGEFRMGATQRDISYTMALCNRTSPRLCALTNFRAETPPHTVRLGEYGIGRTEVSNAQWEPCVRAGACRPRARHRLDRRLDAPELPVVDVTWNDAVDYCRWRGGRLPTEAEWERAARGSDGRRFPWGNLWNGALCNHGQANMPLTDDTDGARYAAPVTAYAASRSPYGVLNAAGNVWEWVADWYDENAYQRGPLVSNPPGPSAGSMRTIRGGSWASPAFAARTTTRGRAEEQGRSIDIGFRCAWDR